MHTLVGAGSSGRGLSAGAGLDVANLLKPPLTRGQLQVSAPSLAFLAYSSCGLAPILSLQRGHGSCVMRGQSEG